MILTHGPARPGVTCLCSMCGWKDECTVHFDFYGDPGEPLLCQTCFERTVLRPQGITGWLGPDGRFLPFKKDDA